MGDARLRDLERRARLGEGRGEWLLAAHRAGALPAERLRLAAACGDADAAQCLGEAPPLLAARGLFDGFRTHGRYAVTRVALGPVLAEANLRGLAGYVARLYRDLLRLTLEFVERPCDNERLVTIGRRARSVRVPMTWGHWRESPEALLVVVAARCAAAGSEEDARLALLGGLHAAADPAPPGAGSAAAPERFRPWEPSAGARESVLDALDRAPALLAELRRGLAGWALGEPPPLASTEVDARLDALRSARLP